MGSSLHNMSSNRSIIALHRRRLPSASRIPTGSARPRVVAAAAAAHLPTQASSDSRIRRSANYKPTSWDYEFLQSFEVDDIDNDELYKGRVTMLERNLKLKLASVKMVEDVVDGLELIDDIQRLGLAHCFENEIREALDRLLDNGGCQALANKYPSVVRNVALGFRLLRQNGYRVSQDVFKEFLKGNNHDDWDVKDMLSLYEASYLAHEGEYILDEARERTTKYLHNFLLQENTTVKELVRHSLEFPLHRRMEMLDARWYIESYNKIKVAKYPALVELATLEFNMAQSVLQRDLKDMSRWWSSLGLAKELSFSRDRLVECFFWTVGMMFQPRFSLCRKGLTKVTSFITTIDDIYDVYGTLEELELFTDAVERWDINAVDTLPDYMKPCFLAFHNTVTELSHHTNGHNILPHLTKVWTGMLKAFLQEAEWSYDNKKQSSGPPTFTEYMENAWRSVSGIVILVHTYCLLNDHDGFTEDGLESHLMSYDKIFRWPSVVFRLCNDLATSPSEIARGETVNAVSCYMNENGVSEEEARKHLNSMIDQAWKNMNQELLVFSSSPICMDDEDGNSSPMVANSFLKSAVNLARIAHHTYQRGDSHGDPDAGSKKTVFSLIFQPIHVNSSRI